MTQAEFMAWAKKTVLAHVKSNDKTAYSSALTEDDVFIVWYCKTLQNHKAILISCLRDGVIYEFTYNGDKDDAYLDAYKKWENIKYDRP